MIYIAGGEFTMGSDHHYAEEKPAHRVKVGGFWVDNAPVTNAEFKRFVKETGHVTFAEIDPDPKDYPGALPHLLRAGSLVFVKSKGPVDLTNWSNWWSFTFDADWRHPYGPGSSITEKQASPEYQAHLEHCRENWRKRTGRDDYVPALFYRNGFERDLDKPDVMERRSALRASLIVQQLLARIS